MGRSYPVPAYIETPDGRRDGWLLSWGKPTAANLRTMLTRIGKKGTFYLVTPAGVQIAEVTL